METKIFSELYNDNKALLAKSPDFLVKLREDAMRQFLQKGFPTKKDEQYKYTYLAPVFQNGYKKYLTASHIQFDVNHLFKCDVPSLNTLTVVLLNGFYFDSLNPMTTLPDGVIIGSLNEALQLHPQLVAKYLGKYASTSDSLVALNTAFIRDGVFIYVPKGKTVDKPIQIINVLLSEEELMVQHRNLFILEPNSKASIVVCDHSLSSLKFLTNSVTEISLAENAHLAYSRVQNEHNDSAQVSHTFVNQEAGSNLNATTITLHGGLVRNNVNIKLDGEGCDTHYNGLFVTDMEQHVDSYIYIDHAKPNCTSNQLFKGILDNKSTGAFTGRILVSRDAQKTAAYQRNSNILLSDDAKVDSKPQLEIYADDVKCSHGATVGQLDEEALFYLRARGISEREAKLLLMHAFADEVIAGITIDSLRFRMSELVEKRLRGELSRCHNCSLHFE
jgi:Fe-S cluster assembly protein SufD